MRQYLASVGCITLLASCGAGTAAIAASSDSGSSSSNAPSAITDLTIERPKEASDTTLHFVLSDRESNPAVVTFYYDPDEDDLVEDRVELTQLPENPMTFDTTTAGAPHVVSWFFQGEPGLPQDGSFLPAVGILAEVTGGNDASIKTGLGNDAPVVEGIDPIPGEVDGIVGVVLTVSDSSGDVVDIDVEYNADAANGFPESSWMPATAAQGDDLIGIEVEAGGTDLVFFWDTELDLGTTENDVKLRFTPTDRVDPGDPFVTPMFSVDNNRAPTGIIEDGILATNPDETRGIGIPFTLFDDESDEVRVVFQWRRERQLEFPPLPDTVAGLEAALADEDRRRELQICTEQPLAFGGRVQPPPAGFDPTLHVTLPELAGTAASLLVRGLEGRTLEILRASQIPEPVAATWTDNPLKAPVAALPVEGGPTAIVLDSPSNGSWRMQEIDLANGNVVQGPVTGPGHPTAMDFEPEEDAVVVASNVGSEWRVHRVELDAWTVVPLVSAGNGATEVGPIRDILCLGTSASMITVGGSLIRVDYPGKPGVLRGTGAAGTRLQRADTTPLEPPRASTVLDYFATPWGMASDPLQTNRVYLAERDYDHGDGRRGRVVTVELDKNIVEEAFVDPGTVVGEGLEQATSIALERNGARLLVLTSAGELRGLNIGGAEPGVVFELGSYPAGTGRLAVGKDGLRMIPLASEDELTVGGGLLQIRKLTGYDAQSRTISVAEPLEPAPEPNAIWRIRDTIGTVQSSPTGSSNVFVWDSTDVPQNVVHLRMLPFDTDVGLEDEGLASKPVRSFREPISIGGFLNRDFFGRWVVAKDLNQDGRPDLATARARDIHVFYQDPDGSFPEEPNVIVSASPAGSHPDEGSGAGDSPGPAPSIDDVTQIPGAFGVKNNINPLRLVATDLNDDGRTDLVFQNASFGDGMHLFLQPTDGFQDRARPDCSINSVVWEGGGHFFTAVDLDRDGRTDLASNDSFFSVDGALPPGALRTFIQLAAPLNPSCPFTREWNQEITSSRIKLPFYLESGDVNGDGRIDLLVGNVGEPGPEGVGFWTAFFQVAGSREGHFSEEASLLREVLRGSTVDAADVNRDGRLDIVSANMPLNIFGNSTPGGPSTLAVFLQDELRSGWFPESPDLVLEDPSTIDGSLFPLLEDLNADGRVDLVTANFNSTNMTVFLQTSSGGYSSTPDLVLTGEDFIDPWGIDAADLDGDGRLDLVGCDQGNGKLSIFEQSGPGRFGSVPDLELGTSGTTDRATSLTAADLSGDGLPDLVSANPASRRLAIFLQRSPGEFFFIPDLEVGGQGVTDGVRSVYPSDLDGDADLDLVCANRGRGNLTIFEQTSPGLFCSDPTTLGSVGATDGARSVVAADLDGDGDADVVSANRDTDSLTIFSNPGSGFGSCAVPGMLSQPDVELGPFDYMIAPIMVKAVDIDADGDLDLVSANESSDNLTVFSNPGGGFQTGLIPEEIGGPGVTDKPLAVVVVDLDGNGEMDLASANAAFSTLTLFFQEEGALDAPPVSLPSPVSLRSLDAADFDADGDLDLVTANFRPADEVNIYSQTSPRRFVRSTPLGGPEITEGPAYVLAADLNSDGEVDLACSLHRPEVTTSGLIFDLISIFFNGK